MRGREEQLYTPALVAAAVRAAADVGALDHAERHTAWLSGFLNDASPPIARAHLAGAVAECDRARGASSAEQWDRVARGWDQLQHPYRAGYARCPEAEALLAAGDREAAARALFAGAHGRRRARRDPALRVGRRPGRAQTPTPCGGAPARIRRSRGTADATGARGPRTRGGRPDEPADRQPAAHHRRDRGPARVAILGKLEVSTRGQAAAIARQAAPDQALGDA